MMITEALELFHTCPFIYHPEHDCSLCPLNKSLGLPLMPDYTLCGVIEDLAGTLADQEKSEVR